MYTIWLNLSGQGFWRCSSYWGWCLEGKKQILGLSEQSWELAWRSVTKWSVLICTFHCIHSYSICRRNLILSVWKWSVIICTFYCIHSYSICRRNLMFSGSAHAHWAHFLLECYFLFEYIFNLPKLLHHIVEEYLRNIFMCPYPLRSFLIGLLRSDSWFLTNSTRQQMVQSQLGWAPSLPGLDRAGRLVSLEIYCQQ